MALTAYCKKCGREVEPGEVCPRCGTRLGKNAAHAAWCVERRPVADWMYWNSVTRLLLPAALLILLLVLLAECLAGGTGAAEQMITSGFLPVLLILLGGALALVFAALLLQGKELSDFVVDNRGIHETRYLPNPTRLKLIARLKSPARMDEAGPERIVKLSERDLPWKNVARVQLWPEKCMILFYAPGWWLRIPVICTPFSWEDTTDMIREKLGKKKKVRLPASLVQPAAPRAGRSAGRQETFVRQMRMEDLEPAGPEEQPPADGPEPEPLPADYGGEEPDA